MPSGQDETIYVFTAKGAELFYNPLRVYKVRGLFEAGVHTGPVNGVNLCRRRQAQVAEAIVAKIMQIEDTAASPR